MHDPEAYFEPEIWAILPEHYNKQEDEDLNTSSSKKRAYLAPDNPT
jgi:hypothetical protein